MAFPFFHYIIARELLHNQVVSAETLESSSLEGLAVVRVCDGCQQAGALLIALSVKIYGTPLGYNPMHVES